jgi:5-carboxymethyl-2-hydroxymuconate isomerase
MPHLKIEYTANLDPAARIAQLCQALAAGMAAQRDPEGRALFPLHGTRVLAYPAPFHAVADGQAGQGFVYMNLRITPGRAAELVKQAGDSLLSIVCTHFKRLECDVNYAVTLHIDEISPQFEGRYRPAST